MSEYWDYLDGKRVRLSRSNAPTKKYMVQSDSYSAYFRNVHYLGRVGIEEVQSRA